MCVCFCVYLFVPVYDCVTVSLFPLSCVCVFVPVFACVSVSLFPLPCVCLLVSVYASESANVSWTIPYANKQSRGYYTCNVTNMVGQAAATTYLDIKGIYCGYPWKDFVYSN